MTTFNKDYVDIPSIIERLHLVQTLLNYYCLERAKNIQLRFNELIEERKFLVKELNKWF